MLNRKDVELGLAHESMIDRALPRVISGDRRVRDTHLIRQHQNSSIDPSEAKPEKEAAHDGNREPPGQTNRRGQCAN
jgi:hypothetical protein